MSFLIKTGDTVSLKEGPWNVRGMVKAIHVIESNTWADVDWNTPTLSKRINIQKIKKIN